MPASRGGPAARNAINPHALVLFVDAWSEYVVSGWPKRTRLTVNGIAIAENDARMIRRWRVGQIKGVTVRSASTLLKRYGLTLGQYATYCKQNNFAPTLRGKLPKETHVK